METESSVQEWEEFKSQLKQVGEQIGQIAHYLREGKGSREEIASFLDELSVFVGTTMPNEIVIS